MRWWSCRWAESDQSGRTQPEGLSAATGIIKHRSQYHSLLHCMQHYGAGHVCSRGACEWVQARPGQQHLSDWGEGIQQACKLWEPAHMCHGKLGISYAQ